MVSSGAMNALPARRRGRKPPASEDDLAEIAVRYLERFPTTTSRMQAFLRRKVADSLSEGLCSAAQAAAWTDAVVRRMVSARLLDDRRWAESRARVLHRRGRALRVIRRDLLAHGLPQDLADAGIFALSDEHPDVELQAAMTLARRRRLGPWAPPERRQIGREKHLAVLARAGFSFAIARRVVDAAEAAL